MEFSSLFVDPAGWQIFSSGQARGSVTRVIGEDGQAAVRLDYDFHGGGGFVVMRRPIAMKLPHTFEIGMRVRGDGPRNHVEFKVASPGGVNVWRHLRKDFRLPGVWSDFRFHEREFPFAWGPAGGGAPSDVEAVEIVVAAGPGGKGYVEWAGAYLEDQTLREPSAVCASSFLTKSSPGLAWDGGGGGWRAADDDESPYWSIDFGRNLRFGGLVIHWPDGLPPRACVVELSEDGVNWSVLRRMERATGEKSYISAHGAEARKMRVVFRDASCAAIRRIEMKPDAFSSSPNEFMHAVAADQGRGMHPRYWHREQSYWTPVGSPEGRRRGLINEEGLVEVDEGGFSLEPFILTEKGLVSWADVRAASSMEKGGYPVPSVEWKAGGLRLSIMPWVDGVGDDLALRVTYRLKATKPHGGIRLVLGIRPFQVNPPWQAFRNLGGCSPIERVSCDGEEVRVNERIVVASPKPVASGAALFEEGGVQGFLEQGIIPSSMVVEDATGLASAAMCWPLAASENSLEVTVSVPYFDTGRRATWRGRRSALARWKKTLGAVEWQVPECAREAFACLRSAAGHILINRDGAAIQPGPRRYTRSWVRDCVIMGAALVKSGLPHALDEFIRWYAQFQREDGFVPCVVDRDGVDWLVEHDSHGQFLWGVREVFRARCDVDFLVEHMSHVRKAADYLMQLRAQRMTGEFLAGVRTAGYGLLPESISLQDEDTLDARSEFFGLLPESASHEGYLAHPVHSYWDDFWGVRGLQAAGDMAEACGFHEDALRWRREADGFQDDLLCSLNKVIQEKKLAYIPGSVEWADFDPTATANAIGMLDFADVLPADALHATLDSYLSGHRGRHGGGVPWNNYSAYEIRIIGAFVRVGNREVAHELLEFFLTDRRPAGWNQWPEITWSNPRAPGHLGDVPHTWIAAEYIVSLTSMVAQEREATGSLVLASGMPWRWVAEGEGFGVGKLPTRYGPLNFRIRAVGEDGIRIEVADTISMPPGGLRVVPPVPVGMESKVMRLRRGDCEVAGGEIDLKGLPCTVEVYFE